MRGEGVYAEQIGQIFRVAARKNGFEGRRPEVSAANFRRVTPGQLELF
jgi:hypothetical protein